MKPILSVLVTLLPLSCAGLTVWFFVKITAYVVVGAKELKPNEYGPMFIAANCRI